MPVYIGRAISALSILAISAYIWFASEEFPANGHQLPQFTSGIAMVLSLFLLGDAFRNKDSANKINIEFTYATKKQYLILLLTIIYIPTMFVVGYFVTSFCFLLLSFLIAGVRNFRTVAITVVVSLPIMYAFFVNFLHAQLPQGWFF
jgi:hypothetical protein